MGTRRELRNHRDIEVVVLDTLVDHHDERVTMFELHTAMDVGIDTIGEALSALKDESLTVAEEADAGALVYTNERVIPDPSEAVGEDTSLFERPCERLGLWAR